MKKAKLPRRRRSARGTVTSVLFLLPALAMMAYAVYIPFARNIVLSFQKWNGFTAPEFVGLDNFREMLHDPAALHAFWNSIFLAVVGTAIAVALGVLLAAFIFKVTRREGAFYRLIIFLPVMLPTAIVGLLFTFVFNPDVGLLNSLLRAIGLGSHATAWLENKKTVMWCLIFVNVWKVAGLSMMLNFAAMQMLPESIFESSRIDGASYSRQFFSLILPLIKPTILMSATYSLVLNFKSYDLVFVMTRGGPGTVSQTVPIDIMKTAFNFNEFGYSAAMGLALCVVVMLVIVAVRRALRGETYEY
jgi:raffinose/stachyose/melibiose transport system permease protein